MDSGSRHLCSGLSRSSRCSRLWARSAGLTPQSRAAWQRQPPHAPNRACQGLSRYCAFCCIASNPGPQIVFLLNVLQLIDVC